MAFYVGQLTEEERAVYYDMLMTESRGAYDGAVWQTSRVENSTTYYLVVNRGQTAYTENVEGAYAREMVTENGSSVSDRGSGGFTAMLPPGSSLFFSTSDTLSPGLYVGNTAKVTFENGAVFRAVGETRIGALYQKYGTMWELVRLYTDGENVTAGKGACKFRAFSWDAALSPQQSAGTVIQKP